jgi:pimeloyl-ACP methyl ester carboxylesterase
MLKTKSLMQLRMKYPFIYLALTIFTLTSCNNKTENTNKSMTTTTNNRFTFKNGYSEVNGLKMYYEIHGQGKPIVLIHGGGSTIQTNFEKIIPLLAKNRQVIAVELQAHGRTNDRNADLTFEQDADDVATLLKNLEIEKADFFGFSNGGTTTLQIAIRYPELVNKMILGSALAKRNGVPDWFWGFMENAKLENMPELLKVGYKKVAADTNGLQVMHDTDAKRMVNFKDIPDEQIKSINAPTLIIIGDKDVITPEHALELHRQIANSELAIIPGGHGQYIGETTTITPDFKESDLAVPMIERFLDKSLKRNDD